MIAEIGKTLNIGYQVENNAESVSFPISDIETKYGAGGTWSIYAIRPTEANYYAVAPENYSRIGDNLVWTIKSTDVAINGHGSVQLKYTKGTTVKESVEYKTCINRSINAIGGGVVPSPWTPWVETIEEARDEAVEAADEATDASEAIQDMSVVANSVSSTSPATVTKTVDPETGAVTLTFGIPRGADGGNVFIAQYGQTSFADVTSAFNSGKIVLCIRNDSVEAQYILSNLTSSIAIFTTVFDATSLNYTQARILQLTSGGWSTRIVKLQRYGETPSASMYNHHIELLESTETEPTTSIDINLLSSSSTPITSTSQLFSTMENHPWTFLRGWYGSMGYSIMSIRLINSTIYMLVDEAGSLTEFTIRGFEGITDTVTTA